METYEEIYNRMSEKYTAESGFEIDSSSDIAIRLRLLAGEIYNAECSLEWLKSQMFADTAAGENLDKIASERGIARKAATYAEGELIFSVNETLDYPIEIPEGTVAATNGELPVRVYTTEAAVLPQATYSVRVHARAELPGYNGNIASGTAEVPVNVPAGIDAVTNATFIGGDNEESDETLRARIKKSYLNRPNPANAAFYKQLAESVDGVDKAGTVERFSGVGTVGVFVARKDWDVTDEALAEVSALIQKNKPIGISASVLRASHIDVDLDVSVKPVEGYESAEVVRLITNAFTDYIGTIELGGTFYLSELGRYMYSTGCILNYEFDGSMQTMTSSGSQFFRPGDILVRTD